MKDAESTGRINKACSFATFMSRSGHRDFKTTDCTDSNRFYSGRPAWYAGFNGLHMQPSTELFIFSGSLNYGVYSWVPRIVNVLEFLLQRNVFTLNSMTLYAVLG